MQTRVTLRLDDRRAKKDGTYPLNFVMYRNGTAFAISSGYCLLKKDWDAKKRKVKNSYKGSNKVNWLNNALSKQRAEYVDAIGKLEESGESEKLSNIQLKNRLLGKKNESEFFEYGQKLIDQMIAMNKVGNARIYKSVLTILGNYQKGKKLRFEDITYDYLNKFERNFFKKEGNSANGLSVYMRTIRAIYNKAIKEGLVKEELYPFKKYRIKSESTQKRAISAESIKKIEALEFEEEHPLFHTHKYFLVCFYLMGLPFVDMAGLKKEDIVNGRLKYRRQKTGRRYDIGITEKSYKILSYYIEKYPDSKYIFPIIKRTDPSGIYKDIEWARNRYNKKLRRIAKLCGIDQQMTSYVTRHSFATLAKNKGVPISAISEMLGHENIRTTQVYLDSLPSEVIDKYHMDILED